MPRADVKPLRSEPGWGCSCKSFRYGEPTPEQALAALVKSASVTVEGSGWNQFIAWTNPETRYIVTFDQDARRGAGFCKHCTAALTRWAPWHRQLALGADNALAEIKRLKKELRAANRKITRLEAKV